MPFLLSIFLVFLGLWIRRGIDETPVFRAAQARGQIVKIPILETIRHQWKEVLVTVGAKVVETAPFYIFSTFIISFGTINLGFDKGEVLRAVTMAMAVTTILIPLMGALSDRVGRKALYVSGTLCIMAFAFPYFHLLSLGSPYGLNLATVLGLGLFWAPITAVLGSLFSEIFKTGLRYTGITLGYQIGAAVAGGTAPFVATWLLGRFDNAAAPIAVYVMLTGVISLAAISVARPVNRSP